MRILGIVLLILGAVALGYQGFTYSGEAPLTQLGSVSTTVERQRAVWVQPLVGGIAIVSGLIVLVTLTRRE